MRTGQFVIDPRKYLELKAYGLTDREIAAECNVHPHTVRNRLVQLYRDMGAHNGYNAVALAVSKRIIPKVTGPRPGTPQCESDTV